MSVGAEEERADREYAGLLDHTSDGDQWDTQPTVPCRRQAPPMVPGQARRGPCPGMIHDGVCDWCGQPPRGTR